MIKGRIIKGVGGLYTVTTDNGLYECKARGLFRKQNISPCVGDFSEIAVTDESKKTAYLLKLLPRKNELFRPRVANIDIAIIVFAVKSPDLNLELLDRFIVLIEKQGLDIIICFNKADLINKNDFEVVAKTYADTGYKVMLCSASDNDGVEELLEAIKGSVSVFAGPSGVGKSSIVNSIFSKTLMETGGLSKIERGKHTTRHAEFLPLDGGGFIVDTPGFASLTTENIPKNELMNYFIEFKNVKNKCKFSNCIHDTEPDCAVKAEVGCGISERRYKSYIKMLKGDEID